MGRLRVEPLYVLGAPGRLKREGSSNDEFAICHSGNRRARRACGGDLSVLRTRTGCDNCSNCCAPDDWPVHQQVAIGHLHLFFLTLAQGFGRENGQHDSRLNRSYQTVRHHVNAETARSVV